MRPDNPDVMFVTDAWAGIHRSTDGGRHWININAGITTRTGPSGDAVPVFCATIDPNNHDIVWVGTQNARGIYRSEDNGDTWEKRTTGIVEDTGLTIRGISVEPGNSDVVYAAGEISSFHWAGREMPGAQFDRTEGVVYRSTDAGRHWQAIWRGDNLARYVLINPSDVNTIYISTGIFDREAANTDVDAREAGGVGIVKSTDGGKTWRVLNEANGLTGLYVGSLFMHPENPDILLAGVGHDYWSRSHQGDGAIKSDAGVFLSTDGGESWVKTQDDTVIMSVEFSLSDPDIAYAAGSRNFYRSEDGGRTWQLLNGDDFWGPPGIVAAFPIDIQVDPRDPMRLFVNNYQGGNFLSEDGGETWGTASNGYSGAQISGDILVDPENPARLYVGALSGLFYSYDGGATWQGLDSPPARFNQINSAAASPDDFGLVIKSPWDIGSRLFRSQDGGWNWTLVDVGGFERLQFLDLAFTPSEPRTVFAALGKMTCKLDTFECEQSHSGAGVYVSHDAGKSWQTANDANIQNQNTMTLAVHPQDSQTVYAGTANSGVYQTTDGGQSWRRLKQGLSATFIRALALDPVNPETVYVGSVQRGIFRSTDGGNTWQQSSAGMNPEESINAIIVDPVRPGIVYAGSRASGVYLSEDWGTSWRLINDGLDTRAVITLAISSDGEVLYAGTQGGGVFRLGDIPPELIIAPESLPTPQPPEKETPSVTQPRETAAPAAQSEGKTLPETKPSPASQTPETAPPSAPQPAAAPAPPATQPQDQSPPVPEGEKTGNIWIYIAGGVFLLGLVTLGIWYLVVHRR
jgi:photosystem II stability/assembly factor-like uncharacterized protein